MSRLSLETPIFSLDTSRLLLKTHKILFETPADFRYISPRFSLEIHKIFVETPIFSFGNQTFRFKSPIFIGDTEIFIGDPHILILVPRFSFEPPRILWETPRFSFDMQRFSIRISNENGGSKTKSEDLKWKVRGLQ